MQFKTNNKQRGTAIVKRQTAVPLLLFYLKAKRLPMIIINRTLFAQIMLVDHSVLFVRGTGLILNRFVFPVPASGYALNKIAELLFLFLFLFIVSAVELVVLCHDSKPPLRRITHSIPAAAQMKLHIWRFGSYMFYWKYK